MTITNKQAEKIAAGLKDKLHYQELNKKGSWHIPCTHKLKHENCYQKISTVRLKQMVGSELGQIYKVAAGYTQADLNATIKFMEMYLMKPC